MSYRGGGTVRGPLRFTAITSPGVSALSEGLIYFDSGTNRFLVSENNGSYVNLVQTPTLQSAYNGGQTITEAAVAGSITQTPITISNSIASATDVLQLNKTPGSAQGGSALAITMNANTTGNGLSVTMTAGAT